MSTQSIQKFNIHELKDSQFINIISKRNTEENARNIIKKILNHYEDKISRYVIISPSTEINNFYNNIMSNDATCKFYNEYNSSVIQELLDMQQYLICNKTENYKSVLILDNCFSQIKLPNKQFDDLIYNSRHYGITVICLSQSVLNLPPDYRNNSDYVILLDLNGKELIRFWNSYANVFLTYNSFKEIFEELVKNNCAMIIDNSIKELNDCVTFIECSTSQNNNIAFDNNWLDYINKFFCCF